MTFSEAIKLSLEEWGSISLQSEKKLGKANQVDFIGIYLQDTEIRVEIERRREDPLNNVVKAWRQAKDESKNESFILLHIFSGFYKSKKSKMQNAIFVGDRMSEWAKSKNKRIQYIPILLDFTPPSGDSNPDVNNDTYNSIKNQILKTLVEIEKLSTYNKTQEPI